MVGAGSSRGMANHTTMDIAVLDLGSASFHLLHARCWPDGSVIPLRSMREAVHLGEGVARTGAITREAWARGIEATDRLMARIEPWGVPRLVTVATGVLRDACNGRDFVDALRARYGLPVEILSRDAEAALAYRGARSEFSSRLGRFCVVDLGGGSIEIAVGEQHASLWSCSLPLGVLRLRDLLGSEPGRGHREAGAALADLHRAFASAGRAVRGFAPAWLVLASGTARAVRDLVVATEGGHVGKRLLTAQSIRTARHHAWTTSPGELRRLGVAPDRVATIPYAAIAIEALLDELGQDEAWVSRHGLREGVILRELDAASASRRANLEIVALEQAGAA